MTVPWPLHVFELAGYAIWFLLAALALAAVIPERAAAEHRTGPRGWWRRWNARNERVVREREARRDHS